MENTANNPMELISYGLYLVTAKNSEGKDNGCIVNTFSQITSTPNRVFLAVNKANYTHDIILATGKFNVSLLTTEAPFTLFHQFGFQSGKEYDKFEGFTDVKRGENDLLYLTKYSNACISATVASAIDCGTHTLFIATVSAAEILSDKPSLTYDYYHKKIKPAPEKPKVKGWRCKICGFVYEGETLPDHYICPLCKHGAEDFEPIYPE